MIQTLKEKKILHVFLAIIFVFGSIYVITALTKTSAADADWQFTTGSDYTYDVTQIQILDDKASLIESAWYDSSWGYRKSITIDRTKIPNTNQVYFPIVINTIDVDLKDISNSGKVGQSDGGDILFTNSDKITKLDHQKESYDPTTGSITYWVEVPNINSDAVATDTIIYMYYGSSTASDQWTDTNSAWDEASGAAPEPAPMPLANNSPYFDIFNWITNFSFMRFASAAAAALGFQNVYHLSETDIDGGSGDIKDSTVTYNLTSLRMAADDQVAGKLDGSFSFDGINDFIGGVVPHTSDNALISMWIKPSFAYDNATKFLNRLFVLTDGAKTITASYNNIQNKFVFTDRNDSSWSNTGDLASATDIYFIFESSDGALYAGTGPSGDVFKSTNNGTTWTNTGDLDSALVVYTMLEASNGTLYVGAQGIIQPDNAVFKSTNGGTTWTNTGVLDSTGAVCSLLQASDGSIYAGTCEEGNVFKSTDNGDTWVNTGDLLDAQYVNTLIEATDGALYAGTRPNGDIFKSTNGGTTWTNTGSLRFADAVFKIIETTNGTLLAGTGSEFGDIFRSTNSGATWANTGDLGDIGAVYSLLQASDGTLYAGTASGFIYKSTDDGDTWTNASNLTPAESTMSLLEASDGSIYAATTPNGDVYKISSNVLSSTAQSFSSDTWIHLDFKLGASEKSIYINGAENASTAYAFSSITPTQLTIAGDELRLIGSATNTYFGGVIDEFTISNTERGDDWIATTYNNQMYPDQTDHGAAGFYNLGLEESGIYSSQSPQIVGNVGVAFTTSLDSFTETLGDGNEGTITYQISNNDRDFYYFNASNWVTASGVVQSNTATEIDSNIDSFVDDVGTGTFYFKAYLTSDGDQLVSLDQISITHDVPVISTGGGAGDTLAPEIRDIQAVEITTSTAQVTWATNEFSDSTIEYGTSTQYGGVITNIFDSNLHTIDLSELSASTTYHYKVSSRDPNGNLGESENQTFITQQDDISTSTPELLELDIIPPPNVFNFSATPGDGVVHLRWTPPTDPDYAGVRVIRKTTSTPENPFDGKLIFIGPTNPVEDYDVVNGTTYYYGGFSFDSSGNYSAGIFDSTIPVPDSLPVIPPTTPVTPPNIPAPISPPVTPPNIPAPVTPPTTPVTPPTASTQPETPIIEIPTGPILPLSPSFYESMGTLPLIPNDEKQINSVEGNTVHVDIPISNLGPTVTQASIVVGSTSYKLTSTLNESIFQTDFITPPAGTYNIVASFEYVNGVTSTERYILLSNVPGQIIEEGTAKIGISGAVITLFSPDGKPWDGSKFLQPNPIIASNRGYYSFSVENGTYVAVAEKSGYESTQTAEILITNNVFNENIVLIKMPEPKIAVTPTLIPTSTIAAVAIQYPEIQTVVEDSVLPLLLAVSVINTVSAFSLLQLLSYLRLLFTEPTLIFARRKKKKWGTVYNALSKTPIDLAIIRLLDAKTHLPVRSAVTDRWGRYVFQTPPGQYLLEVIQPGFIFPTAALKNEKSDVEFVNLYHGEPIEITDSGTINLNIPLDPVESIETPRKILWKRILRSSQTTFAISAIIISSVAFIVIPSIQSGLFIATHCVLFTLFRRLGTAKTPKPWGIVRDKKTNKPLSKVIIRVFDVRFNKLLETQISERSGSFGFLARQNIYYVTAEKEGYTKFFSKHIDLIDKQESSIDLNIQLEKEISKEKS